MIQLRSIRLMPVSQRLDGFGGRYRIVAARNADVRPSTRGSSLMFTMTTLSRINRVVRPHLPTLDD
jgi:hypothetical protein